MDRQLIVWLHIIKAIQKAGNYNISIWDGQDGKRDFGINARLIIHDSRYEMDAENTCSFRRSALVVPIPSRSLRRNTRQGQ